MDAKELAQTFNELSSHIASSENGICSVRRELLQRARAALYDVPSESSPGICFFCGEPMNGKHEDDCPQAAHTAEPTLLPCRVCGSTATPTRTVTGHGEHWFTCVSCREQTARLKSKLQCVIAWNERATAPGNLRTALRKHRLANAPLPNDVGMRVLGFVVPFGEAPFGPLSEQIAKIIERLTPQSAFAPIYQIGAPGIAGHQVVWWDVTQEEYERQKAAGYMRTGIVYREAPCS